MSLPQKTMTEGKDYCERKINLLKSNFDQLVEVCFPLDLLLKRGKIMILQRCMLFMLFYYHNLFGLFSGRHLAFEGFWC